MIFLYCNPTPLDEYRRYGHILGENVTKLISSTTMSICIAIPDGNTLALIVVICISTVATIVDIDGILNGNTFRLIIRKFTFGNITGCGNCVATDICSSIMIVIYCLRSVWLSPNTRSAVTVFYSLYVGVIFCAMQGLNCGGIPLEWLRKYVMTMASIVSDFGDTFLIFLSIVLVFCSLLHHLLGFDMLHNLLEISLSYLDSFYKSSDDEYRTKRKFKDKLHVSNTNQPFILSLPVQGFRC